MRRACLAVLAFVLLCAGCSGARPSLDEGVAREVDPVESSLPAAADATAGAPADLPGATLRLAVPANVSLDPADAGPATLTNQVVADLLFEGLTTLGDDGAPLPALAERWFVSDDRLTWTFVLSAGLTDADDVAVTARDVKGSLERVAARGGADHAATALTVIAGWTDYMEGAAGGVAGISAPDESTLVIRLSSPYELLLNVLATPAFGVTGETDDGSLRLTGSFQATDDPQRFVNRDDDAPVEELLLVADANGPAAAMAAGAADWAVLAPFASSTGLQADIVRQPLDVEVAMVARHPDRATRLGLLGSLEPLLLAGAVDGLIGRTSPQAGEAGAVPAAALLEFPDGPLATLGDAVASQLETEGVDVIAAATDADAFAVRVADGEALLFPVVIAGGTGPASAALRLGVPGASDDVFGPQSEARAELAAAVVSELDVEQRDLFVDALEQALIDDGLLLPIGQYEVRVAIGDRLDGLRVRSDGTLDIGGVREADAAG